MSCNRSFCSYAGSKRRSNSGSGSSSASKRSECESPNPKPGGSQNGEIPIENFTSLYIFVKLLGFGAFGVVNLMKHQISGELYAVKNVKKMNPKADSKTRCEIELGMGLKSQYLCKVHSYHEDDEHFFIIMEYLEGMDLFNFIKENPTFFINNPKIFWVVIESILHGLVYLHSQGIAHMDIKPENVFLLLDNEGNIIGVKLVDLGLAIKVNDTKKCFRGTFFYMAPEFFHLCLSTGLPADIWSLGITAFAMLKESLPIASRKKDPRRQKDEIYSKIGSLLLKESFNPFKKRSEHIEISKIEEFILSCLIVNPKKRPTSKILLDGFIHTISQMSP